MEFILAGSDSMIVIALPASDTTRGIVSFCHECAILSRNTREVLMPFHRFPIPLALHKVL